MPLDPSFWSEDGLVQAGLPLGAHFTRPMGLTNFGRPQRFLRINRGDELRVSWPLSGGWAVLMSSNDGGNRAKDKNYGLITGWRWSLPPSEEPALRAVGWLPLTITLLEMIRAAYETMDPAQQDITIKRDLKGRWGYESHDTSILSALTSEAKASILVTARQVIERWPGHRTARELF